MSEYWRNGEWMITNLCGVRLSLRRRWIDFPPTRHRRRAASKEFQLRLTVFAICMTACATHTHTSVFYYGEQWRTYIHTERETPRWLVGHTRVYSDKCDRMSCVSFAQTPEVLCASS